MELVSGERKPPTPRSPSPHWRLIFSEVHLKLKPAQRPRQEVLAAGGRRGEEALLAAVGLH